MSMDNKPSSALFRRAEQLERWEESDTNKESSITKTKCKKIQFSLGCVFLAACASGDKDEVLKLLEVGADIDSTNVDGLSALHQACIDDNLDMVEFLIEHGADINKGDNEGWTPLHATASCGFISIAKYLIEQGADIAAVNNDGELAVDIAESDEMEDMLQQVLNERGIDCDSARNEEERLMLMDAQEWLENGVVRDIPHPKTGATALHVAAAKGYIKVMKLLIQAAVDINSRDYDGWTPLHAAAHWGQKESCEILAENFCNMDIKNYVGQTAFDIADPDVTKLLEELRSKQKLILKERSENYISRNHVLPKKRNSMADKLLLIKDNLSMNHSPVDCDEVLSTDPFSHKEDTENRRNSEDKIVNHNEEKSRSPLAPSNLNKVPNNSVVPNEISSNEDSKKQNEDVIVPLWRRPASFKGIRTVNSKLDDKTIGTTPNAKLLLNSEEKPPEVVLRRTQSFEADEKFYRRYCELRAKINAGNSCPVLLSSSNNTANTNSIDSTAISAPRSNISKEKYSNRKTSLKDNLKLPLNVQDTTTTSFANSTGADSVISAVPSVTATNVSNNKDSVGRSFVPPVRDEESETQRKAHAKRVRETRRSTQGVTLEEIKSAEQLVKKKQQQQQQLQQATQQVNKANNASGSTVPSDSQFMLEDARSDKQQIDSSSIDQAQQRWSISQPPVESADTTTITLPLRKVSRSNEENDQDYCNTQDSKTTQGTQALIQRRRRPKRRSTGVVQLDNNDPDDEKQEVNIENGNNVADQTSSEEKAGRTSRLNSTSITDDESNSAITVATRTSTPSSSENGEIDYKKLYEEVLLENNRLKNKMKTFEEQLLDTKSNAIESCLHSPNKSYLSELEKRERRAMERKLSEMEEELKNMEQLRQENQRLKDENGALIRVISKLSK